MGPTTSIDFFTSYIGVSTLSFRTGSSEEDSGVRGSTGLINSAVVLCCTLILEDLRVLAVEAEREDVFTETGAFLGTLFTSVDDLEETSELRRIFARSWIAACKSLRSCAISALVAPWHKAENGPHTNHMSSSDSGRGTGGGSDGGGEDVEDGLVAVPFWAGRFCLLDLLGARVLSLLLGAILPVTTIQRISFDGRLL